MVKILLQANTKNSAEEIQKCINLVRLKVQRTYDRNAASAFLKFEAPRIMIIEETCMDKNVLGYIDQIRSVVKFDRPIVLILNDVNRAADYLRRRRNVHVVSKASMPGDLSGLLEKLLQKPNLSKQRHQRHITSQSLDIENMEDGKGYISEMRNLSSSGAKIEFSENPLLEKGALLRMKVRLSDVNKSHNMHAEVVWTNTDPRSGKVGCGVRFINEQTMYKQLMNRI